MKMTGPLFHSSVQTCKGQQNSIYFGISSESVVFSFVLHRMLEVQTTLFSAFNLCRNSKICKSFAQSANCHVMRTFMVCSQLCCLLYRYLLIVLLCEKMMFY